MKAVFNKQAATNLSRILAAERKKHGIDGESKPEEKLLGQIKIAGLPRPKPNFHHIPGRQPHLDGAWPDRKIAYEVQGGTRYNSKTGGGVKGAHIRTGGYERDRRKINEATLMGWKVYEFTSAMIESGEALGFLERALK